MADSLNDFFNKGSSEHNKGIGALKNIKSDRTDGVQRGGAQFVDIGEDRKSPAGVTPPGWFDPSTNHWVDDRLSQTMPESEFNGDQKSINTGLEFEVAGEKRKGPPGLTPVSYFKTEDGEIYLKPIGTPLEISDKFASNKKSLEDFEDDRTSDFKFGFSDSEVWPDGKAPTNLIGSKNSRESFDGSFENKSWEPQKWWSGSGGTPHENEDPVYFGFEIIIDSINSPLINKEIETFIEKFGVNYEEIGSKKEIIESFKWELSKYFKFTSDITEDSNIFKTALNKKHYIKKISGLEKLSESNGPKDSKSFVKYKDDILKISFYEDTTLSTGTLANLYKLIYWSRLNGKNIIPENLLRFDCYIIASEVRNIARVRKAVSGAESDLEVLKENLSRYVYKAYECQFHFSQLTHPNDIDLGEDLSPSQNLEVEISFKFADMKFERFVFEGDYGNYKSLWNSQSNPQNINPQNADKADISDSGILPGKSNMEPVLLSDNIDGFSGGNKNKVDSTESKSDIDKLKTDDKRNIYKAGILPLSKSNGPKRKNLFEIAGRNLLNNLKKTTLNVVQQQLNTQFRLLNNSIDKIRNSFGIGRIPFPTNIYGFEDNTKYPGGGLTHELKTPYADGRYSIGNKDGTRTDFSEAAFGVKNSVRGFAGDILSGLINKI